ncbi:Membrane protein [[Clostridium] ultunense Esp]|uniref:Membrane protein n=1 Tax=[Clostridium] ultunense Esp TaxID=1288971 RepID=M1Z3S2_9FIRM|nr:YjiH family protein [Schnuerera ultunensis]CCQ97545.1 Membrane protein [[Clostridium] ultunense Esp]SHD77480.1 Membrane protein [[Clostridium] ultunense Esp]
MAKKYDGIKVFKFILYAAIGVFMFFVPITVNGKSSIPLDHIVSYIQTIPYYGPIYSGLIVTIGGILPFIDKTWNKDKTTTIFSFIKLLGIVFVFMAIFNRGPGFLMRDDVIPFIHQKIVISVTTIVPIGSIFLAFLVNYGLMEFIGVLMQPIMKPIWKTPGRSAIDAVASFVGSYSLALLITDRVYQEGKYTGKEAAIIATGFSTVSATFMIIVAKTLGLMDHWLLYFWLTLIITFVVTAITARIYPLSKKPEIYYNNQEGYPEKLAEGNRAKMALEEGMKAFDEAPTVAESVIENFKSGIRLALSIGPLLMSVGVIGIVLAEYTPLFDIVGYIFYPFTLLTRIPEPLLAAKANALSIAEMFLPALLVTEAPMMTRFLIAIVSVSEILFFSASIPCMMATEIPLTMKDYIIIWVERVILSILIAAPILHLIL